MQPSEEIKDKINIVDLISEYVELKKAGVNYKARCPFHEEKTPSFVVSPAKQIWHCFGCGLGGDIFTFVKEMEAVDFPEALRILASRAGVELGRGFQNYQQEQDKKKVLYEINDLAARFYEKVLETSQFAQEPREYLRQRGFLPATLKKWRIGFAPDDFHVFEEFIVKKGYQKKEAAEAGLLSEKDGPPGQARGQGYFDRFRGRIMFPLFDIHGRVAGFTARTLSNEKDIAKYVNSPETETYNKSHLIYGLNFAKSAIRQKDEAVVVEGNVDVITCHEAGFENVVGSSGTAFTRRQLETVQRFSNNISFAFDTDAAGLAATRRAVEEALKLGFDVRIIEIPAAEAKDPDELIRKDPELWRSRSSAARPFMDFYFDGAFDRIDISSSIGKKQAAARLIPLIALLPHYIDRAHYVKKLADRISVEERAVAEYLRMFSEKTPPPATAGAEDGRDSPSRARAMSREQRIERRLLGFLVRFFSQSRQYWEELTEEDFHFPDSRRIFGEIKKEILNQSFEISGFLSGRGDVSRETELLIFAIDSELEENADWNFEKTRDQLVAEFKSMALKRRMKDLSGKIQAAEGQGQRDLAKELSLQFNNLSKELQKYYAQ